MSANNYILIRKKEGSYIVQCKDADTGHGYDIMQPTKSLRKAVTLAEKYCTEEDVEYGIRFFELE